MASSGPPRHQRSRVCRRCLLAIVWAGAARLACSSSAEIISEQKFDTTDRGSTSAAGVAGSGPVIAGEVRKEIRYSPANAAVLSSKVEGTTGNWSSSALGPFRGSSCQLGLLTVGRRGVIVDLAMPSHVHLRSGRLDHGLSAHRAAYPALRPSTPDQVQASSAPSSGKPRVRRPSTCGST